MRIPTIYTAQCIKNWENFSKNDNGNWFPARPIGYNKLYLIFRLQTAWRVFTGELDALNWQGK